MSFSFGFYNSLNHDRLYDATQMSKIFDGIINDGVYATVGDQFIVKASENENEVIVSSGRAWFNHTWNYNDADLLVTAPEPDLLMARYDALVLDINENEAYRTNSITWVSGTPSLSNPTKPTLISELEHHQYALCYVYRTANTATIKQEDIENVIGTSETPFVTGIIDTINTDDLLLQWSDQWVQFITNFESTSDTWMDEQKADFLGYVVEMKNQMADFYAAAGKEFTDWFAGLQDILDEATAGHLQNEIEAIQKDLFNKYYGLIAKTTEITKTATGDKRIIETSSEAVVTTTIHKNSSTETVVTSAVVPTSGNFNYTKTTTITKSTSETLIQESYTTESK